MKRIDTQIYNHIKIYFRSPVLARLHSIFDAKVILSTDIKLLLFLPRKHFGYFIEREIEEKINAQTRRYKTRRPHKVSSYRRHQSIHRFKSYRKK